MVGRIVETDVIENLVDFLMNISELRIATLEVQLRTKNVRHRVLLGQCSASVRCIVDFTTILASSIESTTKDQFRNSKEFEYYSELHQDAPPYTDISDVRGLTNTLTEDFTTLFKAYYKELHDLNMLEFPKMILFNLNEIKTWLQKITA
jgi:hypothetical protein